MFAKNALALVALLILAACQTQPLIPPIASPTPTSTATALPTASPTLLPQPTQTFTPTTTPAPTPTPAPVIHTVKGDDDMFGISLRYGISLEALKTANPTVNPYAMSEGLQLLIPITPTPPTAQITPEPTPAQLTPEPTAQQTPFADQIPTYCYRDSFGGAWCLVDYSNDSDKPLENVSARVTLRATDGDFTQTKTALLPLNLIEAHARLPLAVYFEAPTPAIFSASAEFDFSLPVADRDTRYLSAALSAQPPDYATNRLTATLTGEVAFSDPKRPASSLWIVAIAYDASNHPVGFRRYEAPLPISAGRPLAYSFQVYSLGAAIDHVDLFTEARPVFN